MMRLCVALVIVLVCAGCSQAPRVELQPTLVSPALSSNSPTVATVGPPATSHVAVSNQSTNGTSQSVTKMASFQSVELNGTETVLPSGVVFNLSAKNVGGNATVRYLCDSPWLVIVSDANRTQWQPRSDVDRCPPVRAVEWPSNATVSVAWSWNGSFVDASGGVQRPWPGTYQVSVAFSFERDGTKFGVPLMFSVGLQ